jgi:predicted MFS family arabinose efflux permease
MTGQRARRSEWTVAILVFITIFATTNKLGQLPIRSVLRVELGTSPTEMAQFFAVTSLGWYIKPLAGLVSDQLPILGSRRRHYLGIAAIGGAISWVAAAFIRPSLSSLLIVGVFINLFAVLGSSVTGGLLVDMSRHHHNTGRVSSMRVMAMNLASLVVGPFGGWLAGRIFPLTCATGAALMLALLGVAVLRVERDQPSARVSLARRLRSLAVGLGSRPVWVVLSFSCVIYLSPSLRTTLYFHQHDVLGISDQVIGFLESVNCVSAMFAGFLYYKLCNRFTLKMLLVSGILTCAISGVFYGLYTSLVAAVVIEVIVGFCMMLMLLPLQELAVRVSPSESGAFTHAFILGMANLAISLSDIVGVELKARISLSLADMGAVNVIYLLMTLLLIPVIPAALLGGESDVQT